MTRFILKAPSHELLRLILRLVRKRSTLSMPDKIAAQRDGDNAISGSSQCKTWDQNHQLRAPVEIHFGCETHMKCDIDRLFGWTTAVLKRTTERQKDMLEIVGNQWFGHCSACILGEQSKPSSWACCVGLDDSCATGPSCRHQSYRSIAVDVSVQCLVHGRPGFQWMHIISQISQLTQAPCCVRWWEPSKTIPWP